SCRFVQGGGSTARDPLRTSLTPCHCSATIASQDSQDETGLRLSTVCRRSLTQREISTPIHEYSCLATGRQNEPFMPPLAAANCLERPLSCASRAPQIGGPILPQGH